MEDAPLDVKVGDIVAINLAHPIRYDDGQGGEELRYEIRIQVEGVSIIGVSGRGPDDAPGPITPTHDGRGERLGGSGVEGARFFPWSAIANLGLGLRTCVWRMTVHHRGHYRARVPPSR